MATQAFYRKWRSQTFAELVGQEHVTRTLLNAVRTGRVAHGYVFSGPRGVGKTSAARLLAKAVNCEASVDGEPCNECLSCRAISEGRAIDVMEIDAASNRGIDDIRDLREKVNFTPSELKYKLYILDEAHQLSGDAAAAFLKTLEEPPPHTVFVLATTEGHKLLPTILSRCQHLEFRRISLAAMVTRLRQVCAGEGIEAETAALELIARAANGGLRDAEGLLDQLVAYTGNRIDVDGVRAVVGVAGDEAAHLLVESLTERDLGAGMRLINQLIEEGIDPKHYRQEVVSYLRGLMLLKSGTDLAGLLDVTSETLGRMNELAPRLTGPQLLRCLRVFAAAEPPTRGVSLGQLPLEMAFFEAALALNGELPGAEARAELSAVSEAQAVRLTPTWRPTPARPAAAAEPPHETPIRNAPAASAPPRHGSPPSAPPAATASATPAPPIPAPRTTAAELPVTASPSGRTATRPAGAGGGDLALNELAARWPEIVERSAGLNRSVQALLRDVRPAGIVTGSARLGCKYQFHCDKLNDDRTRTGVEDLIAQVTGKRCRVTFVVDTGEATREVMPPADPFQAVMDDSLVKGAIGMGWRLKRIAKDGEVYYDAESQDDPAAAGAAGENPGGAR